MRKRELFVRAVSLPGRWRREEEDQGMYTARANAKATADVLIPG